MQVQQNQMKNTIATKVMRSNMNLFTISSANQLSTLQGVQSKRCNLNGRYSDVSARTQRQNTVKKGITMMQAIPPEAQKTSLKSFNGGSNAQNNSVQMQMNTMNHQDINSTIYEKSATQQLNDFSNSNGFGNTFNGGSQDARRSDVQRFALQNQLKAMYDYPASLESFSPNFISASFTPAKRPQPLDMKHLSQSKAFLQDFLTSSFGDLSKDIENSMSQNNQDFTFNELSVQDIKQTYMDEEFAKDNKRDPTVMSVYGFYTKKDPKLTSITSRLGMRKSSRRRQIVMEAKNGDQMDEYTTLNKPWFNFTDFGKQSLLVAAVCSVLLTNADPAFAARSGGRVGGRSFSAAPRGAMVNGINPRGGSTTIIMGGPRFGYSPFGYGGGLFGYNPALSLGLTLTDVLIRENQRQVYLQQQLQTQRELGQDQAQIMQLQAELAAQNQRLGLLNQQIKTDGQTAQYDQAKQDAIEQQVNQSMEKEILALQNKYKEDMANGDFVDAARVKKETEQLFNGGQLDGFSLAY